jgi:hypothetical protein
MGGEFAELIGQLREPIVRSTLNPAPVKAWSEEIFRHELFFVNGDELWMVKARFLSSLS